MQGVARGSNCLTPESGRLQRIRLSAECEGDAVKAPIGHEALARPSPTRRQWRLDPPPDRPPARAQTQTWMSLTRTSCRIMSSDVTQLLSSLRMGQSWALDELFPLVMGELRGQASRMLRHERPGHTLQATALVNEAYLRLVRQDQSKWQDRAHFFAV